MKLPEYWSYKDYPKKAENEPALTYFMVVSGIDKHNANVLVRRTLLTIGILGGLLAALILTCANVFA